MNECFFCKCLKMWRQPVVKFLYITKGSSDLTIWLIHTFQKEKSIAGTSRGTSHVLRTPRTAPFFTNVSCLCVCMICSLLSYPCVQFHSLTRFNKRCFKKTQGNAYWYFSSIYFVFIMLGTLTELCSKLLTYGRSLWISDLTDIQNKEEERAWELPRQGWLYSFEVGKSNPWLIGLAGTGGWGWERGGHSRAEATERLSENPQRKHTPKSTLQSKLKYAVNRHMLKMRFDIRHKLSEKPFCLFEEKLKSLALYFIDYSVFPTLGNSATSSDNFSQYHYHSYHLSWKEQLTEALWWQLTYAHSGAGSCHRNHGKRWSSVSRPQWDWGFDQYFWKQGKEYV